MIQKGDKVYVVIPDTDSGFQIIERTVIAWNETREKYVVGIDHHDRDLAYKSVLTEKWAQIRIFNSEVVFEDRETAVGYIYSECMKEAAKWAEYAMKNKVI